MKNFTLSLALATCAVASFGLSGVMAAQDDAGAVKAAPAPSPNEIVAQAGAREWVAIPASDLLVMDLTPDDEGNARRVIIQLMPAPFSQGWIRNIRKLAAAKWWDGTSINRVQDNYVVQWGDADYDNPESEGAAKSLPADLEVVPESEYEAKPTKAMRKITHDALRPKNSDLSGKLVLDPDQSFGDFISETRRGDAYSGLTFHNIGWPLASNFQGIWPTHCYGMVGVGRNLSPDTGSGAELYTVIGHAPRHLDRNIALVGRVIEGMEHLSSLPRGKGQLGFYEDPAKRVPIMSVRIASDMPSSEQPNFQYLSTESDTFDKYAAARANRRDPFFNVPAGGADICNIPVPIRRVPQ